MAPTKQDSVTQDAQEAARLAGETVRAQVSRVAKDLTLLIALALLAVTSFRGPLIYYVSDHGPGMAQPGVVPEEMALDFAERWALARYTFVPKTFKDQIETLKPWLHPELRSRFQQDADAEEREVRKMQVSSQVAIVDKRLMRPREGNTNTFAVVVTGVRTVWVGSAPPRNEALRVEVTLLPWSQPKRVGQLIVTRSHFTPLFSAAGS